MGQGQILMPIHITYITVPFIGPIQHLPGHTTLHAHLQMLSVRVDQVNVKLQKERRRKKSLKPGKDQASRPPTVCLILVTALEHTDKWFA